MHRCNYDTGPDGSGQDRSRCLLQKGRDMKKIRYCKICGREMFPAFDNTVSECCAVCNAAGIMPARISEETEWDRFIKSLTSSHNLDRTA